MLAYSPILGAAPRRKAVTQPQFAPARELACRSARSGITRADAQDDRAVTLSSYGQLLPTRIASFKSVVDYRDETFAALSGPIRETLSKDDPFEILPALIHGKGRGNVGNANVAVADRQLPFRSLFVDARDLLKIDHGG